jgi:holliday junction DNA helicase RuvA
VIGHLRGRVLRKAPQELVLDVAGVGYRLTIPVSTFYGLGEEGSEVSVRVHTHVREDALALFGFLTETEEGLFHHLTAVSGVGPKLAVNILSGIEGRDLIAALRESDIARLTRIPGVGRKTAERLVVELKEKMPALSPAAAGAPAEAPHSAKEDLLSALGNLGYSRNEAEKGVDRALREGPEESFEDLLRRSLQLIGSR